MQVDPRLVAHRQIWNKKPALRMIYADYYRRMAKFLIDGPTLEIGSGSGHVRDHVREIYMADILPAPWLDLATDAESLPFATASLTNIVMLDVLHHISRPLAFFSEVSRVLRPRGRLVMLDPAITPLSGLIYKYCHPEPVNMAVDPLNLDCSQSGSDPFDSNQALPTLMFGTAARTTAFEAKYPSLKLVKREYFGLATYPMTGGFRDWCLVPSFAVGMLLTLERALEPLLARQGGFRLLIALERLA